MSMIQAENNIWLILIVIISYFLGTLPTAYGVAKRIGGKDIRFRSTGNIGAMNAFRLIQEEKSTRVAMLGISLVLIGDMGKAALAIFLAIWLGFLGYNPGAALIISSLFIVLGHNYSVFFKFRQGGRGIACLMGILLALNPVLLPVWGGTLLFSIFLTQHILIERTSHRTLAKGFSIAGSQVLGRVIGIGIALLPLYFLSPQLFLPILVATILILVKHIERVKAYVRESGILKKTPGQRR